MQPSSPRRIHTNPMYSFNLCAKGVLALLAVSLTACGTRTLSKMDDDHVERLVWPTIGEARPIDQATMNPKIEALQQVAPGIAKLEVYRLLGHPMYREGMSGVREWDYLFRLSDRHGGEMDCQYKVLFSKEMKLSESYWKPRACANLAGPVAQPNLSASPQVAVAVDFSADVIFDFDSDRLSPTAPSTIRDLVNRALVTSQQVETLRVVGYTDRLGSPSYNRRLSLKRADAVKALLVADGVPTDSIQVEGRGHFEPVIDCPGPASAAVKSCLQPNRRVRIEVVAR